MHKRYSKFLGLIHSLGDIFLLNTSFFLTQYIFQKSLTTNLDSQFLLFYNLIWLAIIPKQRLYEFSRELPLEEVVWKLFKSTIIHVFIIILYISVFKSVQFNKWQLFTNYILFLTTIIIWRLFMIYALRFLRSKGLNYRTYIIAGAGPVGQEIHEYLESRMGLGYRFLGFFDDKPEDTVYPEKCIGNIDDIEKYALENEVNEIYCALPPTANDRIFDIIKFGENNLVRVKLIPDFRRYLNRKVNMIFYGSIPVVTLRHEPLQSLTNRIYKRIFDLIFSTFVILLILSWAVPLIALFIKINSKGPVFFCSGSFR